MTNIGLLIIVVLLLIYSAYLRKEIYGFRAMLREEMDKTSKYGLMKAKFKKLAKDIPGKHLLRNEIVTEINKILEDVEGI